MTKATMVGGLIPAAALALGSVAAHGAGPAGGIAAPGFTYVKSLGGIDEYRLEANGLMCCVMPDHSAPVVTFQVTYHVGSRNEVTGTTGATHLLEHMMFKGSERFNDPKGNSIKQYLERVGGQFNATTSFDRTNYFATIGREQLEGYVAIEADRMRHLWLRESDRQAEMTVVRNEYERGKNNPNTVLMEEVLGGGLRGAAVSSPDHRLEERHRARADREAARVLRHLLLAEQCHRQRGRRRRARRRARRWSRSITARMRTRRSRSRASTPRSPRRSGRAASW